MRGRSKTALRSSQQEPEFVAYGIPGLAAKLDAVVQSRADLRVERA